MFSGTDEDTILMLVAARSNDQRQEIKAAYKKAHGKVSECITLLSCARPEIIHFLNLIMCLLTLYIRIHKVSIRKVGLK